MINDNNQYRWFLDAYRLRINDLNDWAEIKEKTGMYDPDRTRISIISHFWTFCTLCRRGSIIPNDWKWSTFLGMAATDLVEEFTIDTARIRYGHEDHTVSLCRGHPLRFMATLIYNTGVIGPTTPEEVELQEALPPPADYWTSQLNRFDKVGGLSQWRKLYDKSGEWKL
eukprot:GHVO01020072.1.p1 GENE.GHVO01020072.1~~GHVO01020072.1.p1  ORF type:complete len:169 (+),score=23.94 GHVO01020072.1:133-639(+)